MQRRIVYTHISLIAQSRILSLFRKLVDLLCLWTAWYESFVLWIFCLNLLVTFHSRACVESLICPSVQVGHFVVVHRVVFVDFNGRK